ncbi:MAG: TIGR03364 family FAD-dependent oxidoreductase [Planctomycetota bacterium]|nr:MAG: TIGR03364 family FAD-dependent oxidoreductase [Planctomycetota bacterium]
MSESFDDAIVGAGVLGLAHAFHLARAGRKVVVFERSSRASGASVRNFGMVWPIGQPTGSMHQMALRSRGFWLEVLTAAKLWHNPVGSLHLAYQADEAEVLAEFARRAGDAGYVCELLTPEQVASRSPAVRTTGLLAGLWSPTEVCVDPRQVIGELPEWLTREFGVRFEFGTAVTAYDHPHVTAGGRSWHAERLIVCSGADFETLYPDAYADAGFLLCKLQMMRSQAYGNRFQLGPMLAGGLTLRHYACFRDCPSLADVKSRVVRETPDFDRYGIHVMASQNGRGELILGDSHEYGDDIEPFDKPEIDRLILDYLNTFLDVPDLEIAARWHGIYAKHKSDGYFVAHPAPGATVVNAVGGAGMTLSFGLADEVVRTLERQPA